ncbi:MAG TPA: fibronectin type III domain-containing protein, partial [Paenibacillus sp.]|nr:fibronectin type III domain-containing protein [Paenibacillus sp.]
HFVEYNTMYDVGRSVIAHSAANNVKMRYNHMFNAGVYTMDNGMTYTYGTDGNGTEIAYNLVHDNLSQHLGNGIYLDNGTSNYIVHHNISYGMNNALHLNDPSNNNKVYNNTLGGSNHSVGALCGNFDNTELVNNIFINSVEITLTQPGICGDQTLPGFANNVYETTDAKFIDPANHDYRLLSSSPAIDFGQARAPYTNGYVGSAPDAGAYERGATPWIAGASNAAAGATVTSNGSLCSANENEAKAVDGLSTTKWCSGAAGDKWLQIDLKGQPYSINRWVVKHAGAGGEGASLNTTNFKLQKSVNGTTWTDVDTVSGNTANVTDRTLSTPIVENRYVRLYITDPGSDTTARIYEFSLYHNGGSTGGSDTQAPTAPTGLTSPSKTETSVNLTWTASTDNVGVSTYYVYANGIQIGSSNTTSFTAASLAPGVAYTFTVKARDTQGNESAASNALQATTNKNALPSPWTNQDIGSVGWTGGASYSNGTFTVAGAGVDIWGTGSPDEFHFVYRTLSGDGEIVARVATQSNTNGNAKSGVMIREALDAGSKYIIANTTPSSNQQSLWRATTQGATDYAIGGGSAKPMWVKLTRNGSTFNAYESANGTTWSLMKTQTISMATNVYIGLAVLSMDDSRLNISTFDNVSFNGTGFGDTQAPSAPTGLTSPSKTDTTVNLSWTASTDNVGVTGYDVYRGTTLAGSTTGATTFQATGLTPNTAYSFTVRAKDAANNVSAASAALSVTTNASSGGGTGSITREYWAGVSGTAVSAIPLTTTPTGTSTLTSLEGPTNWGDSYGTRIRGTITPTTSGTYTFYVAGDDNTELWLSTGSSPANKSLIASVTGFTGSREWSKYTSQQSSAVSMTAGQSYYVEVLHKEGGGGDNVAVGWTGPGFPTITVIPGSFLSPYSGSTPDTQAPTGLTSPSKTDTTVNLSWTASTDNVGVTGYDVYRGTTLAGSTTGATTFQATGLSPNTAYSFTVRAKDAANNISAASAALSVTTNAPAGGTGSIVREYWTGVAGGAVSSIPVTTTPSGTSTLTSLEGPTDWANSYGTRIRGFLTPSTTGSYTFYVAGDDNAELWLSTDGNPANKSLIASVSGWTNSREWTKYTSQQSAAISLTAGQQYYVGAS